MWQILPLIDRIRNKSIIDREYQQFSYNFLVVSCISKYKISKIYYISNGKTFVRKILRNIFNVTTILDCIAINAPLFHSNLFNAFCLNF